MLKKCSCLLLKEISLYYHKIVILQSDRMEAAQAGAASGSFHQKSLIMINYLCQQLTDTHFQN